MKFLYLIQAASGLPEIYNCLKEKDVVLLSYKEQTSDTTIFFPNSTWTTGRNKLREHVIQNKMTDYDWYIFLDEDVVFENILNTFSSFESDLKKLNFEYDIVTVPRVDHNKTEKSKDSQKKVLWWDGMFNCFSKNIFFENLIFPYIEDYDNTSWWMSQEIVITLCKDWLKIPVLQLNNYKVKNIQHKKYPAQGWPVWRQKVLKEVYEKIKYTFNSSVREEWDNKIPDLI